MAIDAGEFARAARGELEDARAAPLGRTLSRKAGYGEPEMSEREWADFGRQASHQLMEGRYVPRPRPERTTQVVRPARVPTGTPRTPANPSTRPSGRSSSLRLPTVPSLGGGPVGRLVLAGLVGLVVLELGSQLTQQYINLKIGGWQSTGAQPAPAKHTGVAITGGASAPPGGNITRDLPGMAA